MRCGTVCHSARQCAFAFLVTNAQVSKAMLEFEEAQARSDAKAMDLANRKVELFTQQLDESNPVLTAISDCMTAEGELRAEAAATSDAKRQAELLAKAEVKRLEKEAGNLKLQVVRAIAWADTQAVARIVGSCRAPQPVQHGTEQCIVVAVLYIVALCSSVEHRGKESERLAGFAWLRLAGDLAAA